MMDKTYEIQWEIEDGYVGKSRPQTTEISLDDFDEYMNDADIENEIYDYVQEDFNQQITFSVQTDLQALIKQIKEDLKELALSKDEEQ